VAAVLARYGYGGSLGSPNWLARPAFLQSFEPSSLKRLALLTDVPRVLLLGGWAGWQTADTQQSFEDITSDASLREVASYAQGVGPWKAMLNEEVRGDVTDGNEGTVGGSNGAAEVGGGVRGDGGAVHEGARGSTSTTERGMIEEEGEGDEEPPKPATPQPAAPQSSGLVARLHAHGLQVHTYTLRDEPQFTPVVFGGDVFAEVAHLVHVEGVDGVFADYPGTLVEALKLSDLTHGDQGGAVRRVRAGAGAVLPVEGEM